MGLPETQHPKRQHSGRAASPSPGPRPELELTSPRGGPGRRIGDIKDRSTTPLPSGPPEPSRRLRILLGAFGDPGHAFPMISLGRGLIARGHSVTMQTWTRWQRHVEAEGMRFAPAPEYDAFPIPVPGPDGAARPLDFYEAALHATLDTEPLIGELRPHVVISDILTLAPALAAEMHGVPCATLIPHVFPESEDGFPIYSFGARLPRTAAGRAFWRRAHWPVDRGLRNGRDALNGVRSQLGLAPQAHFHGGTSRQLALVASFPQLEYPRRWPAHVQVIGPLMWEPPGEAVTPASIGRPARRRRRSSSERRQSGAEQPVVLIAPSTSQDPEHRLLSAALRALRDQPVRVIATWNGRLPPRPLPAPANAKLVEWVSYAKTMPSCDVVICHAGHGTLARALSCGCAVVACPVAGDMNENAARVQWAGAGVRLPRRFISPRPLRLAVQRAVEDPQIRARARALADWAAQHDAAGTAAVAIEQLASTGSPRADARSRRGRDGEPAHA